MLNFREMALELDLDMHEKVFPHIDAKQLDNKSRFLKIRLYNDGERLNITDEDTKFRIYFRKPDNKEVYNDCVKLENENALLAELTGQTLATPGIVQTELVIMDIDNSVMTSKIFLIHVLSSNANTGTGAVESSDEYGALQGIIKEVQDMINELIQLDRISRFTRLITVTQQYDGSTRIPIDFPEYDHNTADLEVYLSGVRMINNIDYNYDENTRELISLGTKVWRTGDEVLLVFYRRTKSGTGGGNPIDIIPATNVTMNPPIGGIIGNANTAQVALNNINISIGGDLGGLDTTDKTSIISAINEINNKLNIIQQNGVYKRFTRIVNLISPVNTILIGINEYNPDTDILDVYMSGVRLVENVAYTINKIDKSITCIGQQFDTEQIILEVIKTGN